MNNDFVKNRAWVEINLDHLEHNLHELGKFISPKTKIMGVVKADAYGHGALLITNKLVEMGIEDFAVATLEEGIMLRKHGIKGNILILGYTNLDHLTYVIEYDLIQTIVDVHYSEKIKELDLPQKLKCHVKINTGMNRIGEKCDDIAMLSKIYENDKLDILGTYSHFCVADSNKEEDIVFTKWQIEQFDACIRKLKNSGYDPGKIHMQSSYGIINYSECSYDYVRIGLLMYGIHSATDSYTKYPISLKPVLSVKARITSIKEIFPNDSVSYGRTYVAKEKRKIATVGIGYADGIPRNLSNQNAVVKIKDHYATIIGRICMDQLVVDITECTDVRVGDIVTLLGENQNISAEEIASISGTITNELLCGLGSRLQRIEV